MKNPPSTCLRQLQVFTLAGAAALVFSTTVIANTLERTPIPIPAPSKLGVQIAQATTDKTEEEKPMTEETTEKPVESDDFKERMHEGDVALGVCGARVSALLWFYEASVAQGRDDLKDNVASLTESRAIIKKEAERRATDDKVDTSVRVMNQHSEELWDDLNKKAEGDTDEFQKTHDELVEGVKECLALFFGAPQNEDKKGEPN